eukprot:10207043-Prorocentrum_lima.AAC.1
MQVAWRFMEVCCIGPSTPYTGEQLAQGSMVSKLVSNPLCGAEGEVELHHITRYIWCQQQD